MRANRKVIESTVVFSMTAVLSVTALTNDAALAKRTTDETPAVVVSTEGSVAGISGILNEYEIDAYGQQQNMVFVEKEDADIVTAPMEEGTEEAAPEETAPAMSQEELEWQDSLMANVNEKMNIREEATEDSEVIGKLRRGDRATIIERGDEWTKITSGNVTGYVKNEYCVMGSEALAFAKANCDTVAKATVDSLRVRETPGTDGEIVKTLEEGQTIKVDLEAESTDEWIAVKYNSNTCYVSAMYVEVYMRTGTALTVEEEAEIEREKQREEDRRRREEAVNNNQKPPIYQGSSLAATVDERTLLATIIYCEAGGSTYECQLGVGAVVINRVKSGEFPDNIYDVIHQRGQFTPAATGKLEKWLARGVSDTAYAAADAALAGQDNTGGALFCNDYWKHAGLVIGEMVFW